MLNPMLSLFRIWLFVQLARQTGFKGELHLSTLANVSFQDALKLIKKLEIDKVVLPRELNIDENQGYGLSLSRGDGP